MDAYNRIRKRQTEPLRKSSPQFIVAQVIIGGIVGSLMGLGVLRWIGIF